MKKISLIALISLIIILLCSCGNFDIKCSISKNNTATMTIQINIPTEGLTESDNDSIYYRVEELVSYWENSLGYDVEVNYWTDVNEIILKKEKKCDSKEEALYELLDMMGSNSSPFINVEGGYTESYLNDYYNIRADVDLTKIVDYDYINKMPEKERDYILSRIEKFTGTVELSLNGKTIEHIGNMRGLSNSVELSLDEPTEIYSLVEVTNIDNNAEYQKLAEETEELSKTRSLYLTLLLCAVGFLVILAILIFFILLKRKNKSKLSDERNKEDISKTEDVIEDSPNTDSIDSNAEKNTDAKTETDDTSEKD